MIVLIAQHAPLQGDIGGVGIAQIAHEFVRYAVGQHDHIAGLAALFAELRHAVDESEHHDQQRHDQRKRQHREQRGSPANGQVSQVVAERNFARQHQHIANAQRNHQRHVQRRRDAS